MYLRFSLFISVFMTLLLGSSSCDDSNEVKMSKHFETESHNNGRNCMDCHVDGRKGEGQWTIAGSCYDSLFITPYPNAIVKLFTEANGQGKLLATIEVDGNGNFYTTEGVDFGNGLYPVVTGTTGKTMAMQGSVKTGACNSCHNFTNCKIAVK